MKVVYVAGPFRGDNAWAIENNVRRAEEAGFQVARLGAMPLIPHTNTRFFHGALPDEFWLEGTMELLYRCDAALFIDGWEKSSGCREEHKACLLRGIQVFYTLDELRNWLALGVDTALEA